MPKCTECKEKIEGDQFVVVKRTGGSPSILKRYPTAKVCISCYEEGEFLLADDSALNVFNESVPEFTMKHICNNCSRESDVIADRDAEKIVITTHRCPVCEHVDRIYITIKKV